jgi:hypothetical protein
MLLIPSKSPELAADRIYNGWIDMLIEHEENNEKRKKLYKPLIPWPEFDLNDMIERTKKLAREYFEEKKSQGQNPKGTADTWEAEAVERLKQNLLYYVRDEKDGELRGMIEGQLWAYWPDTAPPPELTPEQIDKLLKLQDKADGLMESLAQTIKDNLGELSRIVGEEAEIVKDTAAADRRLIGNQTSWFKSELFYQIVNDSAGPSPLKKSPRPKPQGWTKED